MRVSVQEREDTMNHTFEVAGFEEIRRRLSDCANTAPGKRLALSLEPYLAEGELRRNLRETTQARACLEVLGTPPVPIMESMEEKIDAAVRGEMLTAEEIESVGGFLTAVNRMKAYLEKGKERQIGLAFYSDNLRLPEGLAAEIADAIRGGRVDDYASGALKEIRRNLVLREQEIREKTERLLRTNKAYLSEAFVVTRNGRVCLPVRKECRAKVRGSVVDTSSTGATLFVEPEAAAGPREEAELLSIEEDCEVRRILYLLSDRIAGEEALLRENIRILVKLDFVFAKGKLSLDLGGVEPAINTERLLRLVGARHPMLPPETCVPLNLTLGGGTRGIVITGPNTGGKTVAIKTAALFCLMAGAGLHVPCESTAVTMNSQVLCEIGDGQNLTDNLSTFSAHIGNVLTILRTVNAECFVILDEPGSGTDPAEGMGIAIAILEELRKSGCLFLTTTHYPEVAEYADRCPEIENARMAFDRDSLKPLYRLETGKAGESCALYIAKRLGVPEEMLQNAALAAYGAVSPQLADELGLGAGLQERRKEKKTPASRIKKQKKPKGKTAPLFGRGDSVVVYPEEKIGIVVKPEDDAGNVLVQIRKEKRLVNQKRLKLKVRAEELYPEDYDFSILFDSVENRKARHKMEKAYQGDLLISLDE